MKGLIGKKIGMSRLYDESGSAVAVTLVETGPCPVLQVKTAEKEGYSAVQLGFDPKSEKRTVKALAGHCKKAGANPVRLIREFKFKNAAELKPGQNLTVEILADVKNVDVIGFSKGRGFTGTIKRYHFQRGRETHGNKNHRAPGSVGNHTFPARVWPGKKLPGRTGNEQITVRNLPLMMIDVENNTVIIKGALPGPNGGYLILRESKYGKE